jgi:hypothetical protein
MEKSKKPSNPVGFLSNLRLVLFSALSPLQSLLQTRTLSHSVCVCAVYRTVTLRDASGCEAHHRDAVSDVDTMHLLLCYRGLSGDRPIGLTVCRWWPWSSVLCFGSPLDAVFRLSISDFKETAVGYECFFTLSCLIRAVPSELFTTVVDAVTRDSVLLFSGFS